MRTVYSVILQTGSTDEFYRTGIGIQSDDELKILADMVTANDTKKVAIFRPLECDLVPEIYRKANR